MTRRRTLPAWAISLLLYVVAFALLLPGIDHQVNPLDEGVVVFGAVSILEGQVLYRDIWSPYSPGQFYAVATAFKLFGTSILVERLWDTSVRALLAVIAYLLARRFTSRSIAALAWLAVMLWAGHYGFYGYPVFPALAACLASILSMAKAFGSQPPRRARWLALGGLLIGVAALFRHDFAIYGGAGQFLALALFGWAADPAWGQGPGQPAGSWRARLLRAAGVASRTGAPFLVGAALVVAPVAIYFIVKVPLRELRYDLVTFPAEIMGRFRAMPYPPLRELAALPFYLPFLVYPVSALVALAMARRRTVEDLARALTIQMLLVFGLLSWNQARVRSDLPHTVAFFVPAVLLVVILLRGLPGAARRDEGDPALAPARTDRWLSYLAAVTLLLILDAPLRSRSSLLAPSRPEPTPVAAGLPRAGNAAVHPDMDRLARFLKAVTAPGERIFVGCSTHDRIFISEPMIYFLAERPSATRYHDLHPGVATTAPVQQEIADDLERFRVRYLVRSHAFASWSEPNQSAQSSGVKILDDFIDIHYRPATQIGPYLVWRRNEPPR